MTDYIILDTSYAATSYPGIVSLSTAPVVATIPIAIGDNDSRIPSAYPTVTVYHELPFYGANRELLRWDQTGVLYTDAGVVYSAATAASSTFRSTIDGTPYWSMVHSSAGLVTTPTFTDNGDGSAIIGSNGVYNLNPSTTGAHDVEQYSIAGITVTLTDNDVNYIVADFNGGTPILRNTLNVLDINEISVIPVYSIFRSGTHLHQLAWSNLGLSLAERLHYSMVKTERFRRQGGLMLSESATQTINVSAGTVFYGAIEQDISAFSSAVDFCEFWYHSGGVWTSATITQYNNTQYDDGTNLQTLTNNRYAVNYVYMGVEATAHAYVVLGQGDYSLADAKAAQPDGVPDLISQFSILAGRIIVEKNATTATEIDSAFTTEFGMSPVQNHNDLNGRSDADAHPESAITNLVADLAAKVAATTTVNTTAPLTGGGALSSSLTISMPAATSTTSGYLVNTDWSAFNAKVSEAPTDGTAYARQNAAWVPAATSTGVPTSRLINTTSPLTGGGDLSADRTLSMPAGTASVSGYLSATAWAEFNAKLSDAPSDGTIYGRENATWVPVPTGTSDQILLTIAAGSTVTVADGYAKIYVEYVTIDGSLVVDGVAGVL